MKKIYKKQWEFDNGAFGFWIFGYIVLLLMLINHNGIYDGFYGRICMIIMGWVFGFNCRNVITSAKQKKVLVGYLE
jgi:hypothetical protein